MKGIFYYKDGILKEKKGFFLDKVNLIVSTCIAIMAGWALLLIEGAPYIQKFIDFLSGVIGYVNR